jgi:glycosyltransferase involved in cell wall biosynthesis
MINQKKALRSGCQTIKMNAITPVFPICVIIPVRNGENYIAEAVHSALLQGAIVGEVIVIDDGSTDATAELVEAIDDPRVRLISGSAAGVGVSAVRNQGLAAALSPWVMFLDADDRLQLGALQALLNEAKQTDVAVYGDYQRIDEQGAIIGQRKLLAKRQKPSGNILEALLGGNFIVNGGVMIIRRSVFSSLGGFDQRFAYAEDWLAWCRLSAEGDIRFVPQQLVLDYRVHTQSVMMKKPLALEDCLPTVNAVFDDPKIKPMVPQQRLDTLKGKATAHMEAYCVSQAIRAKRYGLAVEGLFKTMVQKPKNLPRMALLATAALIGL